MNDRPTLATVLSDRLLSRGQLAQPLRALEVAVAERLLNHSEVDELPAETVFELIRMADILSLSENLEHRNLAVRIVALLLERPSDSQDYAEDEVFVEWAARAVFAAVGNFPSLNKLESSSLGERSPLPIERSWTRASKEIKQQAGGPREVYFTDAQYRLLLELRNSETFSFSGPTSMGKSFVLKNFLRDEIRAGNLNDSAAVFLVPTNALIDQTLRDLKDALPTSGDATVISHPEIPTFLESEAGATVFVLTPERLLRLLKKPHRRVAYLIIDEAHRVVSENDQRSPVFYHAIDQVMKRHNPRTIFSSPVVGNPELLPGIFGAETSERLLVEERAVTQQRFYVDFTNCEQFLFPSLNDQEIVKIGDVEWRGLPLEAAIRFWADGEKSIVYLGTPRKVVTFARKLGLRRREPTPQVKELIETIQNEVHPEYFLVECLRFGVAFHHGKIPVSIRRHIEKVFAEPDSGIDFMVCTSTLLEGVNLPAKNIFILTDKHGSGRSKINKLNFENLAGRAGRLSKDFLGNVICVQSKDERWSNPWETIEFKSPEKLTSFMARPPGDRKTVPYKYFKQLLRKEKLPSSVTQTQEAVYRAYATVLLSQHSRGGGILHSKFLEKVPGGKDLLRDVSREISVDENVLSLSPEVFVYVQQSAWRKLNNNAEPFVIRSTKDLTFDNIKQLLEVLSDIYDWPVNESSGPGIALFPKNDSGDAIAGQLRYWAFLFYRWVLGDSTRRIIDRQLEYFTNRKRIWLPETVHKSPGAYWQEKDFTRTNAVHVNYVIEKVLYDLEYGVRFKIMAYLENYRDLCEKAFDASNLGINLVELVEFGTDDPAEIDLQKAGLSRESARDIVQNAGHLIRFGGEGNIAEFSVDALLEAELKTSTLEDIRAMFSRCA
ncbi:DEAD/DEAH box helicase [Corynebacterium afermentans]|nr:DEAD/DEAH box helicase [Corynebacterium afermentans]